MVLAAVGQICSRNNVAWNLKICKSVIARAAARGATFICLPEASDFIAPPKEGPALSEPLESSSFVKGIQEEAKKNSVWVAVGVHEAQPKSTSSSSSGVNGHKDDKEDKRGYNTQCLIDPSGKIASVYRKLHLFDVDRKGGASMKESDSTRPGQALPDITETTIGNVGMLTCYDLRFPQVPQILREKGAHVITYPSAFTVDTGRAHWEPLLRARAIETQCYVLAAAQVGSHPPTSRTSYGQACIIDPWGTILATCHDNTTLYEDQENPDSGSFCLADIDLNYLEIIREGQTVLAQRREEVYAQK